MANVVRYIIGAMLKGMGKILSMCGNVQHMYKKVESIRGRKLISSTIILKIG